MRIILDQAKSVDEAIEILGQLNIQFPHTCGHHLLADAYGNTAIIEYIDGKMIVNQSQDPWQVTTNFLMDEYQPVGSEGPCWRYREITETLGDHRGMISNKSAMKLLETTSTQTVWSIVYNLTTGTIDLSLGRNYDLLYTLNLDMQFKPKPWFEVQQAGLIQK